MSLLPSILETTGYAFLERQLSSGNNRPAVVKYSNYISAITSSVDYAILAGTFQSSERAKFLEGKLVRVALGAPSEISPFIQLGRSRVR